MAASPRDARKKLEADFADSAPVLPAYQRDFYSWLNEQVRYIREDRVDALDRDNLAAEIESLALEQFNRFVAALRVLLVQVLQWEHQPSARSRGWALSIVEQRLEIADLLEDNPGLQPHLSEAIRRAYRRARIAAARETGREEASFPATCPYSFDELISRTFIP